MSILTRPTTKLAILAAAWAGAVLAAGALGLLRQVPPALVGVGIAAAAAVISSRSLGRGWVAEAMGSLGLGGILAINILRLEGLEFLRLSSEGRLPALFADRAGWGDVAAAVGAIILLFWRGRPGFRTALLLWNVLGTLDLAVAVGTATWFNLTSPGAMAAFAVPPFCLIPFWAVPLLICGHVYLFAGGPWRALAGPPSPRGA